MSDLHPINMNDIQFNQLIIDISMVKLNKKNTFMRRQ